MAKQINHKRSTNERLTLKEEGIMHCPECNNIAMAETCAGLEREVNMTECTECGFIQLELEGKIIFKSD